MHKIKYEVKNMKDMLVFSLLCYAYCVTAAPWATGSHLLVFSIPHGVDITMEFTRGHTH